MNTTNQAPAAGETPPAKLFTVLLDDGTVWQLYESVPETDKLGAVRDGKIVEELRGKQAMKVMAMYELEDGAVVVYAMPVPGSAFDAQKTAAIMRLYPRTIRHTVTVARFDEWHRLLAEEDLDPDGDDPNEPEEVPANGAAALPAAGGAS
jgi:hypothetical protein